MHCRLVKKQLCVCVSSTHKLAGIFFFSSGDISSALEDLNKAIELSRDKAAAAAQAYTQRGLIHRLNGVEEKALEDFTKAAELGSAFAKTMVVQLNPYAAMCNKMLAEAINKLKGQPQLQFMASFIVLVYVSIILISRLSGMDTAYDKEHCT